MRREGEWKGEGDGEVGGKTDVKIGTEGAGV